MASSYRGHSTGTHSTLHIEFVSIHHIVCWYFNGCDHHDHHRDPGSDGTSGNSRANSQILANVTEATSLTFVKEWTQASLTYILTPQMVVQTVAADALLSECFNYTPLTAIILQFLIATVTITAAYAAHVSGRITTECKEHIDGLIRMVS